MLLAFALFVAPRLGAAVVRAQERADAIQYVQGAYLAIITNYNSALTISEEDIQMAVWALKQKKRRRPNVIRRANG